MTPLPPKVNAQVQLGNNNQGQVPNGEEPTVYSKNNAEQWINSQIQAIKAFVTFNSYYINNVCFRIAINKIYEKNSPEANNILRELIEVGIDVGYNLSGTNKYSDQRPGASNYVFKNYITEAVQALKNCLQKNYVSTKTTVGSITTETPNLGTRAPKISRPFDERLERVMVMTSDKKAAGSETTGIPIMPYDTTFMDAATTGYIISVEGRKNLYKSDGPISAEAEAQMTKLYTTEKERLSKQPYYMGVPSIINTYSLTRLYGSEGGAYLVDQKGERKWYEIDGNQNNGIGYSKVPTTSSIINWGEGDPYGRTPYHFQDFVFCKYWGLIPNNRLITLRRYPAPIVDNLNFPAMDGKSSSALYEDEDDPSSNLIIVNENPDGKNSGTDNTKKVFFPPMATVITYFGEETGNTLPSILKFTAGLAWEEIQANVHDVQLTQNPNQAAGPAGLSTNLVSFAKTLNMLSGNYSGNAILHKEGLPPDPYSDGPYENRIIGPVNAIDKVYKRSRGIEFTHAIPLIFEYTARPIGGINSKAVLLDILSNFLIVGSASAMFWGGQHRWVQNPQGYPFIGGKNAMRAWYSGNPMEWGKQTISTFLQQSYDMGGLIGQFFSEMGELMKGGNPFAGKKFTEVLNGKDGKGGVIGEGSLIKNYVGAYAAEKSEGQIPYLQGHKALLTGEPVGEWHVTIGNPLNPIALIGNLICKNIEVEFGDELGPDDFPLNIKITVNLEHGMARDRDAIESMFNRGMGRIYSLPDNFSGSADYETKVDKFTGHRNVNGRIKGRYGGQEGGVQTGGYTKSPSNHSNPSVWSRLPFASVSEDQSLDFKENILARSEFRSVTWVSQKSLK